MFYSLLPLPNICEQDSALSFGMFSNYVVKALSYKAFYHSEEGG